MITIRIGKKEDGVITKVSVSGHAGYDVAGKDIVCAAVSTVVQLTTLTLKNLIDDHAKITEVKDGVLINVGAHGYDRAVMCVMLGFFEFTNELMLAYPANVSVEVVNI